MSHDWVLFQQYCLLPQLVDRQRFALAHPRLLWVETVRRLVPRVTPPEPDTKVGILGWLSRPSSRQKRQLEYERLAEVDAFRLSFRRSEDWPIGYGPIEAVLEDQPPLVDAIAAITAPTALAIIGPPYLRVLASSGEDLSRVDPRRGLSLARCAAETALAFMEMEGLNQDCSEAVLAFLRASTHFLCETLDSSVALHALSAARLAIAQAETANDSQSLGQLYQAVGALHSDIWVTTGASMKREQHTSAVFLERPFSAQPLFEEQDGEVWPGPREALAKAASWYRRALPYRSGMSRGLTYKSIVQTEDLISLAFGEEMPVGELSEYASLAAELLSKHPEGAYHLQSLAPIAQRRGWSLAERTINGTEAASILELVQTAHETGPAQLPSSERRQESHAAAVRDLGRALRHKLPWALYLRNFDYANEIRLLDDPIVERVGHKVSVVLPQVSYSIVDHKVLDLFSEGVVTICDPELTEAHLLSAIPMLSLTNNRWLPVVRRLALSSTRIVMLIDAYTEGVGKELEMLLNLGAAERTLIVLGHSFRTGRVRPSMQLEAFAHRVDWLDFSYDEQHFDIRHKAHRIVQAELARYVSADVRPTVRAWLDGCATPV